LPLNTFILASASNSHLFSFINKRITSEVLQLYSRIWNLKCRATRLKTSFQLHSERGWLPLTIKTLNKTCQIYLNILCEIIRCTYFFCVVSVPLNLTFISYTYNIQNIWFCKCYNQAWKCSIEVYIVTLNLFECKQESLTE
jgi:hypothetical protein